MSDAKVEHISGFIGCCENYFALFPDATRRYMHNPSKPISGKLSNTIPNDLYTEASVQAASSNAPAPAESQSTGKRLSNTNYTGVDPKQN